MISEKDTTTCEKCPFLDVHSVARIELKPKSILVFKYERPPTQAMREALLTLVQKVFGKKQTCVFIPSASSFEVVEEA